MLNNLLAEFYMLCMLGIVIFVNTLLGSIIATNNKEFKFSILFKGILKAFLIGICLLLFSISIELLPLILNKINIKIDQNITTVLELTITIFTAYKKYAKDCYQKFKQLLGGD